MAHFVAKSSKTVENLIRLCGGDVGLLNEACRACGKFVDRGWWIWRRTEWECDLSEVVQYIQRVRG